MRLQNVEGVTCGLGQKMKTMSWSGNFIPSRRRDERRLLGLHDKDGYAPLSSLGEVQVLSETSTKRAGNMREKLCIPVCVYGQNSSVARGCIGWDGGPLLSWEAESSSGEIRACQELWFLSRQQSIV